MALFKNRFLIAILFFIIGMGVGRLRWGGAILPNVSWSAHVGHPRPNLAPEPDTETEPDQSMNDPFEDLRRMQQQMMNSINGGMNIPGMQTFTFEEPEFKDNGTNYTLEVVLHGMKPKNFNVQVERGQLEVEGTLESATGGASMSSHFQRSFPVPADVDADHIQVDTKNDRLIVTLPKKSGG